MEVEKITGSAVDGRYNDRSPVLDETDVAVEGFIEDGVDGFPFVRPFVRGASDLRPAGLREPVQGAAIRRPPTVRWRTRRPD